MTPWRTRLAVFVAVALLAWGATVVVRPIPPRHPGSVLGKVRPPPFLEYVDSLGKGENLFTLLGRAGLTEPDARNAIGAASKLDPRRLPAGMRVTVGGDSAQRSSRITLRLAVDRLLHLTRTDSGWSQREERLPWITDTVAISGEINSTLYDAFDHGGGVLPSAARAELAWDVADVFEYRLDMTRDLQPGDRFQVLFERQRGPEATVRIGHIFVAEYRSGNSVIDATRFTDASEKERFFDQEGKSMQAMFLRAPLEFRRISSIFGLRKHPILGIWRAHKGTDYAASSGTPVRAIGNGIVVHAGRMRGYGNVIDVRHPNGFVSRYGHLRGFASGIRRGARVDIAQTIGFVGMTGLATAPHLHFEVLVGGVQQNPRVALAAKGGEPLPPSRRAAFDEMRSHYLAMLQRATTAAGGFD